MVARGEGVEKKAMPVESVHRLIKCLNMQPNRISGHIEPDPQSISLISKREEEYQIIFF